MFESQPLAPAEAYCVTSGVDVCGMSGLAVETGAHQLVVSPWHRS